MGEQRKGATVSPLPSPFPPLQVMQKQLGPLTLPSPSPCLPPLQVMQKQLGPLTDMCLKGLVDSHPKVSVSTRGGEGEGV